MGIYGMLTFKGVLGVVTLKRLFASLPAGDGVVMSYNISQKRYTYM